VALDDVARACSRARADERALAATDDRTGHTADHAADDRALLRAVVVIPMKDAVTVLVGVIAAPGPVLAREARRRGAKRNQERNDQHHQKFLRILESHHNRTSPISNVPPLAATAIAVPTDASSSPCARGFSLRPSEGTE